MENIDKNYKNIGPLFLKLINESTDFKNDLQVAAPEINTEIQSFASNPDCTCKNKIISHVGQNREKFVDFANATIAKYNLDVDIKRFDSELMQRMMSFKQGLTFRIKKSEWSEFPAKMAAQGLFIRVYSVLPVNEDEIDVYVMR
jgi:hypothetical protein